ncbi:hypothetical protein GH714_032265 [Hevea brasiliensis]|uniref:Uncharacterized protein n=1 Tax=Hevea brasiliensis TaxID=3981 RepID=A0A6A6N9T0_HEVBR|nr:hypothetical protein GH714_032265 [Hevea brasiliensis]
MEKPQSVFCFFQNLGFSNSHIQSAILLTPQILFANIEKSLKPKIKLFQDIGLVGCDLGKFISKNSPLLTASLKEKLVPRIEILKKLLLNDEKNEDLVKVIRRCNWLISKNPESRLLSNIAYLKSCGIVGSQLSMLLKRQPRLFVMQESRLRDLVSRVLNMGFSINSRMLVHALYTVSCLSDETFERKFGILKSYGFSEYECIEMFRKAPGLLRTSKEKLKLGIDFFLNVTSRNSNFRFYFKCTKCSAELAIKTDPQNSDYVIESGATRNFEPWRAEDEEADKERRKRNAEEMDDAMKSLENQTLDSKREMAILAALDEMKSMKSRHATVSVDAMLEALQKTAAEKEKKVEEEDEALVKSIFERRSKEVIRRIPDEYSDDDDDFNQLSNANSETMRNNSKRRKVSNEHPRSDPNKLVSELKDSWNLLGFPFFRVAIITRSVVITAEAVKLAELEEKLNNYQLESKKAIEGLRGEFKQSAESILGGLKIFVATLVNDKGKGTCGEGSGVGNDQPIVINLEGKGIFPNPKENLNP